MSKDLVKFVSDFENETSLCHGIVLNCSSLELKSKLKSFEEGILSEFFNDEIVARSVNCSIRSGGNLQMCPECSKLALHIEPILQVKLECLETDSKHILEETNFDNDNIEVNDDFEDDNFDPEDHDLKTEEETIENVLKKDPDFPEGKTIIKVK